MSPYPHVNQAPNYSPNAKDNWTVGFWGLPLLLPTGFGPKSHFNITNEKGSAGRQL